MSKFYYNINITEYDDEMNPNVLYTCDGYLIDEPDSRFKERIKLILDDAFDSIKNNFGLGRDIIIRSNIESMYYYIDGNTYNIAFTLINLDYDKSTDHISSHDDNTNVYIVTDLYKITPLLYREFILNRFVVFNTEQEMQLELSDYNDKSGLLFDKGDKVKIIKDPRNNEYVVVGKAGHVRGPQQANLYCVKNLITDDEIDMIHESDLILSE